MGVLFDIENINQNQDPQESLVYFHEFKITCNLSRP